MRTEIPGGWKPVPGPNGLIAHGNGTVELLRPDGSRQSFGEGYVCGWGMDKKTQRDHGFTVEEAGRFIAVSLPMWLDDAQTRPGRSLVYLHSDTGQRIESTIPPYQLLGYFPTVAVLDGSVVSSAGGAHFINGEGRNAETNANDIEHRSAKHYLYKLKEGDVWPLVVREIETGKFGWRLDGVPFMYSQVYEFNDPNDGPCVFANVGGGCELHFRDGGSYALPQGEFRGDLAERNGDIGVATVTNEGWTPVVIVRLLSNLAADAPAWVRKGIGAEGFRMIVTETGLQIMGHDPGDGDLVIEDIHFTEPMQPYVKPVEPPVVLPSVTVPADMPPLLTGYLGGTTQGNLGGAGSGRTHLVEGFTQQGKPWWKPEEEQFLDLVFVDQQESHAPDVEMTEAYAVNDRTGVMLNFYADRNTLTDDVLEKASESLKAGRSTSLGLRCYLDKRGTAAETEARVDAELERLRSAAVVNQYGAFKVVLYAGAYTGSNPDWSPYLDPAEVIRTLSVVAGIAAKPAHRGQLIGLLAFGIKRPPIYAEIDNGVLRIFEEIGPVNHATLAPRKKPEPIVIVQPPVVVKPKPWPWGNADTPVKKKQWWRK